VILRKLISRAENPATSSAGLTNLRDRDGLLQESGKWRTWSGYLTYRRPYDDGWGNLHDPTTELDELLKNYKPHVRLLQVGEGTRRMAKPALAGARVLIREENRRQGRREELAKTDDLEAKDLERVHCDKHWHRRKVRSGLRFTRQSGSLKGDHIQRL